LREKAHELFKKAGISAENISLEKCEGELDDVAIVKRLRHDHICFFGKTATEMYTQDEKLAAIGHEIGHRYRKEYLILSLSPIALIIGALTISYPIFLVFNLLKDYFALSITDNTTLLLYVVIIGFATYPLVAIGNFCLWQSEYHADRKAVELMGDPQPFISFLQKLSTSRQIYIEAKKGREYVRASKPIFQFFFNTHPTINKRTKRVEKLRFERSQRLFEKSAACRAVV
jgi:Zn-dependent protease with chaperone function